MMKKLNLRIFSLVLLVCVVLSCFAGCKKNEDEGGAPATPAHVDYTAELKLDMNSNTLKKEVKWGERSHVDGDTSHFEVDRDFDASGVIKARYLAVDTPETTGQIEEWGKPASRFTKEKLSTAVSIVVESDSDQWGFDSNGRYLLWVWYKSAADADYRCLNIELLQNGLGAGSSAAKGRYGSIAVSAIDQATREKLNMFSGEKDPDFPYGEAASVTLKELRTNVTDYIDKRVAVEGVITYNSDWKAYIESYDAESGMYFGMQVFYGYNSQLINVLAQGNQVRVVGVINEHYGTYQISDLKYVAMRPEDPANTSVISKGNEIEFVEITAEEFLGDKTIQLNEDEEKTFKFGELAVSTSVAMKNLKVVDMYTSGPTASDAGAITLTCEVDGKRIQVRTAVLKNADGELITEAYFEGKTMDVEGIVDFYNDNYQIKVYSLDEIHIHE
jgi:endonuclease YncB( thermonuclease family)/DNA/RNA endonuclease YhcR with UshA esterase domain